MQTNLQNEVVSLPRKMLCVALAAAFAAPAVAEEDDEVARLIKPESNVSVGVGQVSGDNQRFGVYNGMNKEGTVGLINFSVIRRDDETGTWFRAMGRNLGLDNRDLRVEHERQGDWGYYLDFSQTPRATPYEIHTDLTGIGSTVQSYPGYVAARPASTAAGVTLRTERQTAKLGFNKSISPELDFRLVFQNDEKEGNRIFGRGNGTVQEFLAEPIKSTTRQIDAILDYTGEKLQLSGGYYGSFFNNHNPYLQVNGGSTALSTAGSTGVAQDRIGLPPDNYANQFHLAGGYQFTNTTRGSFKVSKSIAIQNDDFMPVNFYNAANNGVSANTSGRTNLGGRLDTTLLQLGLTSRPLKGLTLVGNLRYEDRDDRTAVARYISNVAGTGAAPVVTPYTAAANGTLTTDGFNEPRSLTNKSGRFEANYLLPSGFRVTGGLDVEQKEHSMAGVRVVGYRERTDETTGRLELKRAVAETLTGSVTYLHSDRTGSDFKNLVTLNGTTNYPNYSALNCGAAIPGAQLQVTRCGLVQPIYMADRQRDKVRLAFDWAPIDALSAQFMVEDARDDYGRGRGNPDIGTRKGDARLYSVDVTYSVTDNWKLTGWAARSENWIDQATIATPTSNAAMTLWSSEQKNVVDSYSIGVRGKLLSGRVDTGADYIFSHDQTGYRLHKDNAGTAAVGGLPDITYKQSTIKAFARYALNKDTALRLDYIFDHRRINDWTWTGWTYSDGTQVVQRPEDTVHFIGLSVNYAFR